MTKSTKFVFMQPRRVLVATVNENEMCIFVHCKWTRNMGGTGRGVREGWIEAGKRGKAREKLEGEGSMRTEEQRDGRVTADRNAGTPPPLSLGLSLPPSLYPAGSLKQYTEVTYISDCFYI